MRVNQSVETVLLKHGLFSNEIHQLPISLLWVEHFVFMFTCISVAGQRQHVMSQEWPRFIHKRGPKPVNDWVFLLANEIVVILHRMWKCFGYFGTAAMEFAHNLFKIVLKMLEFCWSATIPCCLIIFAGISHLISNRLWLINFLNVGCLIPLLYHCFVRLYICITLWVTCIQMIFYQILKTLRERTERRGITVSGC